jgi:hypothetical protein
MEAAQQMKLTRRMTLAGLAGFPLAACATTSGAAQPGTWPDEGLLSPSGESWSHLDWARGFEGQ